MFRHLGGKSRGSGRSRSANFKNKAGGSLDPVGFQFQFSVLPLAAAAGIFAWTSRQPAIAQDRQKVKRQVVITEETKEVDVVLSSGFLSFANHSGFLKAVEEAGLQVKGIMGTSAGALSGSLYAAGYSPAEIALELSKNPPSYYLQLSSKPWEGGVLNMQKAIHRYRELLPATFEELGTDFAVGVYTRDGSYRVIDSGPLPEAVVASAAIPFVFEHVEVPGVGQCMDGGKHDRVGLDGWRQRVRDQQKRERPTLVHLITRSSPFSGADAIAAESDVVVVRSPKSGVSLNSLGNFEEHFDAAYQRSSVQLAEQVSYGPASQDLVI